jgi:hypothetical protein
LKAWKKLPYQGVASRMRVPGMSAKSKNSDLTLVATANDLRTGAVVYRARDGAWQRDISRADLALIPIIRDGAFVRPAALREIIRATGPTIELPSPPPRL